MQFAQLERWSVGSFFEVGWRWPTEIIKPLSWALRRRVEEVDRSKYDLTALQLATLHFDGEIEPRNLRGKQEFKGRLFFAHAGDVVYSKIDIRNGAIGVVPESMPRVAVSAEYPVYCVRERQAVPGYVRLLLRTQAFRDRINAMISGASGRKRVQPDALEILEAPIPSLYVQRTIVQRWRAAQAEITAAHQRAQKIEAGIPQLVYAALGTPAPSSAAPGKKLMVLRRSELERWSVNYIARSQAGLLGFARSRYPIVRLGDHLVDTMNGYCIKPVAVPTPHRMLKLSALTPAGLDLTETKFVKVSEAVAKRFCLHRDDLLICRSVGSYEMVGKCAVVEADAVDVLFPDIIIRARLNPTMVPAYVREVMQTPLSRSYFQSNARTAVGMWKIGADDIASFPIPLPPLKVQREIAERIAAARVEIARERAAAAKFAEDTAAEIEGLILGTKRLPE